MVDNFLKPLVLTLKEPLFLSKHFVHLFPNNRALNRDTPAKSLADCIFVARTNTALFEV
jgi:hypothetical protein